MANVFCSWNIVLLAGVQIFDVYVLILPLHQVNNGLAMEVNELSILSCSPVPILQPDLPRRVGVWVMDG